MNEELFDSIKKNLEIDDSIEAPKEKAIFIVMNRLYKEYRKLENDFRSRDILYLVSAAATAKESTGEIIKYNSINISIGKDREISIGYHQRDKDGIIRVNHTDTIDALKSDENLIVYTNGREEKYEYHVKKKLTEGNDNLEKNNQRYK